MTAGKQKAGSAAAEHGPATEAFPPIRCGTSSLLLGLAERARENLSDGDLLQLAAKTDDARCMVRQIATLCEGLGALVSEGGGNGDSAGTGYFQTPADLPDLLWLIGSMADQASGLFDVACIAEIWQLSRRAGGKA